MAGRLARLFQRQLRPAGGPARPFPDAGRQPRQQRRLPLLRLGTARAADRPRRHRAGFRRHQGQLGAAVRAVWGTVELRLKIYPAVSI